MVDQPLPAAATVSGPQVGFRCGSELMEVLSQGRLLAADDGEAARLEELAGRLSRRRLRVLVAGEAKRGKSTLVNALLGRPLLPTGVTPLTSVTTTVSTAAADEEEHAVVTFLSGGSHRITLMS